MKHFVGWLLAGCLAIGSRGMAAAGADFRSRTTTRLVFFPASNANIQYMGRIDLSNRAAPRFWSPGVVVRVRFRGELCKVILRDEVSGGQSHNYVGISVDGQPAYRVKMRGREDTLLVRGAGKGVHLVSICKDTESGIGYLEMAGVICEGLEPPPALPARKIEFIGNSITCGTGMDLSETPCGKGEWYDQHNAWMSYGAQTARTLNAQWHLTSVSGIGLIHSCCKMTVTMPEVFDKMNLRDNTGSWDFSRYQPDVVTVALGQNDGVQDSVTFCRAYVQFIGVLHAKYPRAQVVLLTSPMGNVMLTAVLKRYLDGIEAAMRLAGDKRVHTYFFSRQYSHGCGGHPDLEEHGLIAKELTGYLKKLMGW